MWPRVLSQACLWINGVNGTSHISIYDGNNWDADIQRPEAIPGSGPKYAGATVTYYQYIGNNNLIF